MKGILLKRNLQRIRRCGGKLAIAVVITCALHCGIETARASTNLVFRVKASFQAELKSGDLVYDVKLSGDDLARLALGRTPSFARKLFLVARSSANAGLSTNEVFALAINCGTNNVRLVVFDPNTSSNLATIAELVRTDSVSGKAIRASGYNIDTVIREELLLDGVLLANGNETNHVTSGFLTIGLTTNCKTNRPLTQASGSAIGFIHGVVNGSPVEGLIKSGTIATQGDPLGILVDEN